MRGRGGRRHRRRRHRGPALGLPVGGQGPALDLERPDPADPRQVPGHRGRQQRRRYEAPARQLQRRRLPELGAATGRHAAEPDQWPVHRLAVGCHRQRHPPADLGLQRLRSPAVRHRHPDLRTRRQVRGRGGRRHRRRRHRGPALGLPAGHVARPEVDVERPDPAHAGQVPGHRGWCERGRHAAPAGQLQRRRLPELGRQRGRLHIQPDHRPVHRLAVGCHRQRHPPADLGLQRLRSPEVLTGMSKVSPV
ncbi:hypothetical protein SGPA1_21866 [Streptomyces misionensis JCM 4497]